jgi:hypothetical protein
MVITKVKGTYSEYTCKVSFGQLKALRDSLERDHSGPVADEMYKALDYYLAQLPLPGEDGDKKKEEEKAAKESDKEAAKEEMKDAEVATDDVKADEIKSMDDLDKVAPSAPEEV